jgi:toxin secretion/phage lysis holin
MPDRIFKSAYLTQAAPVKAAVSGGAVGLAALLQWLCQLNNATELACAAVDGIHELVRVLLAMNALDLFTGVLAARQDGQRITSSRFGVGVKRKLLMLMMVASSVLLDHVFKANHLPLDGLLFTWTTSWFIATEALSLYENATRLGVPMPAFLKTAAEKLLQKSSNKTV